MATQQIDLTASSTGGGVKVVARALVLLGAIGAIFVLAFMKSCDETHTGKVQTVKLGGKAFHLEVADTDEVRTKGLGQRDHIEADGGMLFVFTSPKTSAFVMRDCPVDIDIIYLDQYGKISAMHQMKAEPPRGEGEGKIGEINEKYESRLKKYDSRFPTQFVIEIKGGTLPSLNLKDGDKIDLPLEALKKRAK